MIGIRISGPFVIQVNDFCLDGRTAYWCHFITQCKFSKECENMCKDKCIQSFKVERWVDAGGGGEEGVLTNGL